MRNSELLLDLQQIDVSYGPIHALKGVNLKVHRGEIVALLGANGAGKSTTLRAISGMIPTAKGTIQFRGQGITNLPSEKITHAGISHSPEGRQIFGALSVYENLQIGAYILKEKRTFEENLARCYRYFPILKERNSQIASTLSGGEQQMLAIARSLMNSPELLLLDEPSLGLAPLIVRDIMNIVKEIADEGVTVLIVEQNASQTLKIANYGYVLNVGKIVSEGEATVLSQDPKLMEAYLGSQ